MSLFYSIAYRIGFTPWELAATHPPAAEQVAALFDREERDRQPPFGRALDVGCGSGHWAVTLARRGWSVTGIDLVPKAIRAARERARKAGVDAQFIEADVTALRQADVGTEFRFVWDFGTIHGLDPSQQQAAADEISRVSSSDAAILILAWSPGARGPLPRGMSRDDIATAFAGWRVVDDEPFDASGLPTPLRRVAPRVYRLRRK